MFNGSMAVRKLCKTRWLRNFEDEDENESSRSFDDEIVERPQDAVGAGGTDFHFGVRDANLRIAELETALAAQTRLAQLAAQPAPEAAPLVAAKPELTGRARWAAACRAEGQAASPPANTAPVKKDGSKLTGRERFAAGVQIS